MKRAQQSIQSLLVAILTLGVALPPVALATPKGGNVVSGNVSIDRQGPHTDIHASHRSIIEWQGFDIGTNESVRFIQPGRQARVLNRVRSTNPTLIDGLLQANGQVFIVNPHGVYFGGGFVDAAGLVAAAGDITNQSFLGGNYRFALEGAVENRGDIRAGSVALLGQRVANYGQIVASEGDLVMVAGDSAFLTQRGSNVLVKLGPGDPAGPRDEAPAVENHGTLKARGRARLAAGDFISLALHNTGDIAAPEIELDGGSHGIVEVSGTLDASSEDGPGGEIVVLGDAVRLRDASLDASGQTGGGRIRVGGGYQGGEGLRGSRETYVSSGSRLRADALETGDGGDIVVWSDGSSYAYGEISARGGSASGDGGRVETSGKRFVDLGDAPDVSAPEGSAGDWLIDPSNITIVAAADPAESLDGELEFASPLFVQTVQAGDQNDAEISAQTIEDALARGTNVTVTTQSDATGGSETEPQGNLYVNAPILLDDMDDILPNTFATLSLLAAEDLEVNAAITNDSADLVLGVTLRANDPFQPDQSVTTGDLTIGAPIKTGGGSISGQGANTTVRAGATLDTARNLPGSDAGGSIFLQGGQQVTDSFAQPVNVPGEITVLADVKSDGGAISLVSFGGNASFGGTSEGDVFTPGDVIEIDSSRVAPGDALSGTIALGAISNDVDSGAQVHINAKVDSDGSAIQLGPATIAGINGSTITASSNSVSVLQPVRSRGGSITVGTIPGVAIQPSGTVSIDAPIDSSRLVVTDGIGGGAINVAADTSIDITPNGALISRGGDITLGAFASATTAPDITIEGVIDAKVALDPAIAGAINVVGNTVTVQGTVLSGRQINLSSGQLVDADLTIADSTLAADRIVLTAGFPLPESENSAPQVVLSGATDIEITSDDPDLDDGFELHQIASIADDAALPDLSAATLGRSIDYLVESTEGSVSVSDPNKFAGTYLTLAAADAFSEASIGGPLSPATMTLRSAGTIVVSQGLVDDIQPSGDLDPERSDLVLHGQSGGASGEDLEAGVSFSGPVVLRGDEIEIRAGNGSDTSAAFVDLTPEAPDSLAFESIDGTRSPDRFELRQDAEITAASLPAASQFPALGRELIDFGLQADNGSIVIDEDFTAVFAGGLASQGKLRFTAVDFVVDGRPFFLPGLEAVELESPFSFTVAQDLIDTITPGGFGPKKLRLGSGNVLSFAAENVEVRADELTLAAFSSVNPMDTAGQGVGNPSFLNRTGSASPGIFRIEQGAALGDASLPSAAQFANGVVPDIYEILSNTSVTLTDVSKVAGSELEITVESTVVSPELNVTLSGFVTQTAGRNLPDKITINSPNTVLEERSGANLDFASFAADPVQLNVDNVTLIADGGDASPVVLASNGLAIGRDPGTADDALRRFSIAQDGDIVLGDLPPLTAFEHGLPDDYVLSSFSGSIDLGGRMSVAAFAATQLRLDAQDQILFGRLGDPRLVVESLVAITEGDFVVGAETDILATEVGGIVLQAGVLLSGGDLTIEDGARFETANEGPVRLIALAANEEGGTLHANVPLSSFTTSELDLNASEAIGVSNLPTGPGQVETYLITSATGIDILDAQQLIDRAGETLVLAAPTIALADDGLDFGGGAEVALLADSVVLDAGTMGISGAGTGNLRLFGEFGAARPTRFSVIQEMITGSALPSLSRFGLAETELDYQIATESNLVVDDEFSSKVLGTTLTLETPGIVTLSAEKLVLTAPTIPGLGPIDPSLTVDAQEIIISSSEIATDGDQDYQNGTVTLAAVTGGGQTKFRGRNISFEREVNALAADSQSILVEATGRTFFMEEIGRLIAPAGFQVDLIPDPQSGVAIPSLEFGAGVAGDFLVRANEIRLNPTSADGAIRTAVPNQATILRSGSQEGDAGGNLTFEARDGFTMGQNEKLSVAGDLRIETAGTATLADVSAVNLVVEADSINIVRRRDGPVALPDGTVTTDAGVSIVANTIDFDFPGTRIGLLGSGRAPTFGVPDPANPPRFVTQLDPSQRFVVAAIDETGLPLKTERFFDPRVGLLSFTPRGPSNQLLAEALWISPRQPEIPRAPEPLLVPAEPLRQVGIIAETPTSEQYLSRLYGAAIYDDVAIGAARLKRLGARARGETPERAETLRAPIELAVSEPRLQTEEAERAIFFYDRVLGPNLENAGKLRGAIQEALEDYKAVTGLDRVVGFELRRFIKNRPNSQADAFAALEDLDVLFRYHRRSGLAPAEYRLIQLQWLEALKPEGITLEQFSQTIHPSRYVRGSDILDIFGQ